MIQFKHGQIYCVRYSSKAKFGLRAGELEIVSIRKIDSPSYIITPVKNHLIAVLGEIDFILKTKNNNHSVQSAILYSTIVSNEYANSYCNGAEKFEWFSPYLRNYIPIASYEKIINKSV